MFIHFLSVYLMRTLCYILCLIKMSWFCKDFESDKVSMCFYVRNVNVKTYTRLTYSIVLKLYFSLLSEICHNYF